MATSRSKWRLYDNRLAVFRRRLPAGHPVSKLGKATLESRKVASRFIVMIDMQKANSDQDNIDNFEVLRHPGI